MSSRCRFPELSSEFCAVAEGNCGTVTCDALHAWCPIPGPGLDVWQISWRASLLAGLTPVGRQVPASKPWAYHR